MPTTPYAKPVPGSIALNYRGNSIRAAVRGGSFWFSASDLRRVLNGPSGNRNRAKSAAAPATTAFVSEAALYPLANRCLPQESAEYFIRWITLQITGIRAKAHLKASPHQGCDITEAARILSHSYDIGSGRLWSILYAHRWISRQKKKRNRPLARQDAVTAGYLFNIPQTKICPSNHAKRDKPIVQITAQGIIALAGILDNLGLRKTPANA